MVANRPSSPPQSHVKTWVCLTYVDLEDFGWSRMLNGCHLTPFGVRVGVSQTPGALTWDQLQRESRRSVCAGLGPQVCSFESVVVGV